MARRVTKLVLAIFWMPISIIGLYYLTLTFRRGIDTIFGEDIYKSERYVYVDYFLFFLFVSVVLLYFVFELSSFVTNRSARVLTHLRFGSLATLATFIVVLIAYDAAMIEYSRYEMSRYIFHSGKSTDKPHLTLHNDDRGWCGNGYLARENDLYFATASSGLENDDEFVRARSLLASGRVRNWLNGGDKRFDLAVYNACAGDSEVVRNTAEQLLADSNSSCETYSQSFRKKN